MATKRLDRLLNAFKENPPKVGGPRILALEERHDALLKATRLLATAGYSVRSIFEESQIVAVIQADTESHFLLLTVQDTARPLRVPQIVEQLRRGGYQWSMTYCVRGKVSPETCSAYEALSVNRVWAQPPMARASALEAVAWLHERVALKDRGVTVVEI